MPFCDVCEERLVTSQTIEMDGVSERLADWAFNKLCEGKTCAECIITEVAYRDSMDEE